MLRTSCLIAALCLCLPALVLSHETDEPLPIAGARNLLGHDHAVVVQGRVVFASHRLGIGVIQDATGGLAFDMRLVRPLPKPGQMLELFGRVARQDGVLSVVQEPAEKDRPYARSMPGPAIPITAMPYVLDDAATMHLDGVLTTVRGIVRRITLAADGQRPPIVEISTRNGYVVARLAWQEDKATVASWRDKVVMFDAVLISQASEPLLPHDADALMLVPHRSGWHIQDTALDPVFARKPVTSLAGISSPQGKQVEQRLHVSGIVTAVKSRQWVTLRLTDGSVLVQARQEMQPIVPSDILSVACWPQVKGGHPTLLDGVCKVIGHTAEPQPLPAGTNLAQAQAQSFELVTVEGYLRNDALGPGRPLVFTLLPDYGPRWRVQWRTFFNSEQCAAWEPGSKVRITGTVLFSGKPVPRDVDTLSIQPRSLADVHVIAGPSYWNHARLRAAAPFVVGFSGLAVGIALISRRQLRKAKLRVREVESEAIAQEERRRIAREFHDSLQQHLASSTLHLETLKGALTAAPEMAPRLIDDLTAMLRHCHHEARYCIWDLRSETPISENLTEAMRDWLAMRAGQNNFGDLTLQLEGTLPDVSEELAFEIMRIAQEAVNNALAHAQAKAIRVTLGVEEDAIVLRVEDDGRGFDVDEAQSSHAGHYGLTSQRERARKIKAQLDLSSAPGHGTSLVLRVPYQAPVPHVAHV